MITNKRVEKPLFITIIANVEYKFLARSNKRKYCVFFDIFASYVELCFEFAVKPKGVSIISPNVTLKAGKKIDALCKSWGSKPAAKIMWTLNNKEILRTRLVPSPLSAILHTHH
ncbi:hypothetical protein B4U80_05488 [Leptotrombidium deliense]|uniref:Ig-like domain-containing protein n=1 Tax=Leptotrombidium deliense TaxID=299467 RepID=A0A443SWD9_9ACAR|nr:hypothetical protein B4U80_05488 [Leptotrombidium deliense]